MARWLASCRIADLSQTLIPRPTAFAALENLLRDFAATIPLSITSSKRLAELMAAKAAIIKDIMGRALAIDAAALDAGSHPTDLIGQYHTFKTNLIRNISTDEFADIYAETIAYGLFAARLHDDSPDTFSRGEAVDLLPKSNPFLRELFVYIAGPNLDERLRRVIDELCDVFRATDMPKVLKNFGKQAGRHDPFLHFYEVFLAEYNPAKRKSRGVWYTPQPVVSFIVRAVDEVLKSEFGLSDGLADTSLIDVDLDAGHIGSRNTQANPKKRVHRVQILDPATGTGTFLAEVIRLVAERVKDDAPGQWSGYVENDLIPRIHGFELLMASYAMCHVKLDMTLTGLGYKPSSNPLRLRVYLTNSLEEGEQVEQTVFGLSRAIAREAQAAGDIKRRLPIMCVIGNPPYSGHSSNKGAWIESLMDDYKVSPELKRPAQAKWLSDDYVKFVRLAEHMIGKNGEGVLGFITNHGYLDNPTFLDMRHHLLQTFDRIHVLDLHGNSKKKEVSPDGSYDQNVFDIMQGVAIIVAVKRRSHGDKGNQLANVMHLDLWGTREEKYEFLQTGTLAETAFETVSAASSPWRFKPFDKNLEAPYMAGFSVADLFSENGRPAPGMITTHDEFAISWSADEAIEKVDKFLATQIESDARAQFKLCSQPQWNYAAAQAGLADRSWLNNVSPVAYRPFDSRFTVLNSHIVVHRRERVMRHMLATKNIALLTIKATRDPVFAHCSISDKCTDTVYLSGTSNAMCFPLYLLPEHGDRDQSIRVNFAPDLYAQIRAKSGIPAPRPNYERVPDYRLSTGDQRPDEIGVFDYIYAVLHCPDYREKYDQLLRSGYPRIPFPDSPKMFSIVSQQGELLRRLHLMEDSAIGKTPYPFEGDGKTTIEKPRHVDGCVWINATQYFARIPTVAWEFRIGGYQPAQKWLKDRKGRTLGWGDIRHYQKIIKILSETDRIMQDIKIM